MNIDDVKLREIQEFILRYGCISRTWLMKKYKVDHKRAVKMLNYLKSLNLIEDFHAR